MLCFSPFASVRGTRNENFRPCKYCRSLSQTLSPDLLSRRRNLVFDQ